MKKAIDYAALILSFGFSVAALGVVGGFEAEKLDAAGFFIGLGVCIAGIAVLAWVHYISSKKRKRPIGAGTLNRGKTKNIYKKYSK